jgi:hypothetical protein
MEEYHRGETGGSHMIEQIRRLATRRHESEEGKFEIDRAVRQAADELNKIHLSDRKALYRPKAEGAPGASTVAPARALNHGVSPSSPVAPAADVYDLTPRQREVQWSIRDIYRSAPAGRDGWVSLAYLRGQPLLATISDNALRAAVHRMSTRGEVQVSPDGYWFRISAQAFLGPPISGASAEAVRPALRQARSLPELSSAFTSEVARVTGSQQVPHVDMQGSSLATAQEHLEGILRGYERFPGVRLRSVNVYEPHQVEAYLRGVMAFAPALEPGNPQHGDIRFNYWWARHDRRQDYLDSVKRGAAEGWSPPNSDSPVSVGTHEFAHILHAALGRQRIIDQVARYLRRYGRYHGMSPEQVAEQKVSRQAGKQLIEAIAEAFVDVSYNGDQASEFSRGIYDILAAAYQAKFGGEPKVARQIRATPRGQASGRHRLLRRTGASK